MSYDPKGSHTGDIATTAEGHVSAYPTFSGECQSSNADGARREHGRHMTVMRAARLSSQIHKVEGLGVVRNISESGMMIDAHLPIEIGEQVAISLLDGDRVEGEVMWKDGSTIGVRFSSWISVGNMLAKPSLQEDGTRARPPRIRLNRKAVIRIGSYMTDMIISDISQRGAKLKFSTSLIIDSRVQIILGDLRPVSASVKWQAGDMIGIEFHRTLGIEELSNWMPQTN